MNSDLISQFLRMNHIPQYCGQGKGGGEVMFTILDHIIFKEKQQSTSTLSSFSAFHLYCFLPLC